MPSRIRWSIWCSPACFAAWALYIKWPHLPGVIDAKLKPLRVRAREQVLLRLVQREGPGAPAAACWARSSGRPATRSSSTSVAVDGSAHTIGFIAGIVRRVQSGFLYSYAFWMVIGLAVMLGWFLTRA